MTFVAATCSSCKTADSVRATAMLVDLAIPEQSSEANAGRIHWICATCGDLTAIRLDWHDLAALVAAGAALMSEEQDEIPPHPEHPPAGSPFTPDDLLEMHEQLAGDRWFDELAVH